MLTLASNPTLVQSLAIIHVLVLNAVIGLLTAMVTKRLLRSKRSHWLLWVISVYAASVGAGLLVWLHIKPTVETFFLQRGLLPLQYGWFLFWILVVLWAFLLWLGLLPVAYRASRAVGRASRTSIPVALCALILHLVAVVPLYTASSRAGLFRLEPAPLKEVVGADPPEWLYFFNEGDGKLWRTKLDGSQMELVADTADYRSAEKIDILPFETDPSKTADIQLIPRWPSELIRPHTGIILRVEKTELIGRDHNPSWWPSVLPSDSTHSVSVAHANRGLTLVDQRSGKRLELAADLPFFVFDDIQYWHDLDPVSVTLTSSDLLVFQTGRHSREILILNPRTRRYAVVAKGRPALVLSKEPILINTNP